MKNQNRKRRIHKMRMEAAQALLVAAFLLTGCSNAEEPVYIEDLNVANTAQQEAGNSTGNGLTDMQESHSETGSEGSWEAGSSTADNTGESPDMETETTAESEVAPTVEPPMEEEPKEYDIQLMMVGDNLLHMGVIYTGKQADGGYNYDFLFEGIEEFLGEAEIKMINQETIFGGNELGFSGYPTFNSPTEVGDAIVKAGFNVVLHSSNHAADKKIDGLLHCVDYWKQYPEVTMAGIHEAGESPIQILTIDEIDFAILNYTYGPNLPALPDSIKGHLDMLCNYDEATGSIDFTQLHPDVLTDIAEAKEMADVVIVCPHWGREYTTKPSPYQQKFALQMTEAGADIIIGTHPHVVQPMEWIEAENGNRALCYYSLGNYVSTQKNPLCMLEAMAWINFHVTEDGIRIDEEGTGVVPMVCHYNANPVRTESVYLLQDYTEQKAAAHGIKIYGEVDLYLSDLQNWSNEVFGEDILTAEEILGEWIPVTWEFEDPVSGESVSEDPVSGEATPQT